MKRALALLALLSVVLIANAATTGRMKIGGSGPIDRPTALANYWCFNEWQCGTFDSFTADGDSALVVLTVRNWDQYDPSDELVVRIDNFFVVEQAEHDANMQPVGDLAVEPYYCTSGNTSDEALDIASLDMSAVAFYDNFDGAIQPAWSGPVGHLIYETYEQSFGAEDDPFNPGATQTGAMRIGNGTGPEFVPVELQLSGLTPGQDYVISYWASIRSEDDGLVNETCQAPNDDFEIEVFGEKIVCTPDLPFIEYEGLRTLFYNPATNVWRFQLRSQNSGAGPAEGLHATITASSAHFTITQPSAEYGDMPEHSGLHYIGPFEAIVNFIGPESWMQFSFDYDDDCGDATGDVQILGVSSDPLSYPTPAPSSLAGVTLDQNHPNPFNPRTTIEFSLPAAGRVELEIFDARGRVIRTLLSDQLPAGDHDVVWDGRDDEERVVSAGSYFYRLQTESGEQIRKMVLLK